MKLISSKLFFCLLFFFASFLKLNAQVTVMTNVILRSNVGTDTLWDGTIIQVYGFASTLSESPPIPAKTLYVNEGDSLILHAFMIAQNSHHTIHLHGMDVDTRNDGDPSTSFWLNHSEDTTYSAHCNHAGLYLYHCHVGDVVHVQMGMYGMIVVRAANGEKTAWTGGPAFDSDKNWLTSEVDRSWHDSIPIHDTATGTINLPLYQPDYFLVNGRSKQDLEHDSTKITGSVGEKIYLRIGGIGFFYNTIIFPASLNAQILESDGRPLPNIQTSDTLELQPGERYSVMLTPDTEFDGFIPVQFRNMNTDSIWETENVPILIEGTFGIGSKKIEQKAIQIFPNPSSGKIKILSQEVSILSVQIFNLLGEEIFLQPFDESAGNIDVSAFPSGIYFLRINSLQSNYSQRLVIQK